MSRVVVWNVVKVKSLSHVQLFATPWTVAYQAPPSVGFSRHLEVVGCHFLSENPNTWSSVVLLVKNLPANAGDVRDVGLIPGLRRSPGGGNGTPLQYFCWENPVDRSA